MKTQAQRPTLNLAKNRKLLLDTQVEGQLKTDRLKTLKSLTILEDNFEKAWSKLKKSIERLLQGLTHIDS